MDGQLHGRFDGGFGWTAHPSEFMERSSAALAADGKVWLIDPVRAPRVEDEIRALGRVAGIVMTIGWHDRDVGWYSALYGVPVYVSRNLRWMDLKADIRQVDDRIPDSPLHLLDASGQGWMSAWRESTVWWPERRVLCVGDCLGHAGYFVRADERLAVHPLRRLSPPVQLGRLEPERIFCGHGGSVEEGATSALRLALAKAKAELARTWLSSARTTIRHFSHPRERG